MVVDAGLHPTSPSVYADGGVVGINPSPLAGTYAWVHVVDGQRVRSDYGYVVPEFVAALCDGTESGVKPGVVSNNFTELIALVYALEALPDGWSGVAYSDSGITLGRVRSVFDVVRGRAEMTHQFNGIPGGLRARVFALVKRLGELLFVGLAGHPTNEELMRGYKTKRHKRTGQLYHVPVSVHNRRCDAMCHSAADRYLVDTRLRQEQKEVPLSD